MSDLFDTHCHLNIQESFPDPSAAVTEAQQVGVSRLNVVGIDIESSALALQIAERHDNVFATVGVHPNSSASFSRSDIAKLEALANHPKAVAIGEIGLDYYWDHASLTQQHEALAAQLELAERLRKPIVFHCRDAYEDLLGVLAARERHDWLLHCFSGSPDDARRAADLGCYFGIDGPITYPKASQLREIARELPRDRIVIETDSPYLTPAPHRGKPNRPAWVVHVNSGLASCLGIEMEECAQITTANALRFFRIGA